MPDAVSAVDALKQELQAAMRARQQLRVEVLRMLLAACQQQQIDSGAPLTDVQFIGIVRTLIKQRREAAVQFGNGGRMELAAREEEEITILSPFLPCAPSAAALAAAVQSAIDACDARSARDMGRVMKHIKTALPSADMGQIGQLVKQQLNP